VVGFTDNQPILHNLRYPSNYQLSVARAETAKSILANAVGDPSRLTAEGRGESDPIASNATSEGREQNRRIEVRLHRSGSAQ
jgi:type VI secretion system protein ImpK